MAGFLSVFRKNRVLLLLSALFAALPLTFPSLFLLSWVAFVPFFQVILRESGKGTFWKAVGRGIFFGFFYHAFVYFWFLWMYPMDFVGMNGAESVFVVLLAWLGISFFHGVLFSLPTLLCHMVSKKIRNRPFLLFTAVFGILLAERITEFSALAFPWVRISLGQYRVPVLIQFASVFGIEGVDLLILSVSALLALAIVSEKKGRLGSLSLAAGVFCGNLIFGLVLLSVPSGGESMTVTAVQGCILAEEQWSGNSSALETYTELTEENVAEDCELVVWPEGAVPVNLYGSESLQNYYKELSAKIDTPILMGCFWRLDGKSANGAVLLDEDGLSEAYIKRHLVPFGEYMPYRDVLSRALPVLTEINALEEDMAEGTESVLMQTEKGKIGAVICFESVFPELVSESVREGAELLVIITNDGWYKDSPGVWQHLAHAVFRSVENGRSTVRCASSGVSAFIDGKGRVQCELGPLERGTLTDTVTFSDTTTVYTAVGRVLLPGLSVIFVILSAAFLLSERRKKNA